MKQTHSQTKPRKSPKQDMRAALTTDPTPLLRDRRAALTTETHAPSA